MQLPAFYPILDTATAARRGVDPVYAAGQFLEAGVKILQFRHKGFLSREIFGQMEQVSAFCRDAGALFIVNDRADLAALLGAGLHLGQDDLPPAAARRVTGLRAPIGFSTHNEGQLRAAASEDIDYVALGPIFGTSSKDNPDPVVGLEELRRLRPHTERSLVAIGGITRESAVSVLDAGADSIAVISDLFPEDGNLRRRSEEWLACLLQTKFRNNV